MMMQSEINLNTRSKIYGFFRLQICMHVSDVIHFAFPCMHLQDLSPLTATKQLMKLDLIGQKARDVVPNFV